MIKERFQSGKRTPEALLYKSSLETNFSQEKEELQKLLREYSNTFCDKPGLTPQIEHRIKTTS